MSEFVGNPAAFLNFMNSYALFLDDFGDSGVYWATLVESKGGHGLPTTYRLANAKGKGSDNFKIYWCQYKKDYVFTISLYREASLMFTPKMTGCSFAVGIPAADGNVIVGHANIHDYLDNDLQALEDAMDQPGISMQTQTQLMEVRRQMVRAYQFRMLDQMFARAEQPVYIKKTLDTTNHDYTGSSGGIITFGIFDTGVNPNKWRFYFQTKSSGNKVTGVHKIKK